jgi:hypothetical protein
MSYREFSEEEKALIASGFIVAGAIIGTFLVLVAFGSYKKGQVITEIEPLTIPPEPYRNINHESVCDSCGAENIEFCIGQMQSRLGNHCFDCGGGRHYANMCLDCAKWDAMDDDD